MEMRRFSRDAAYPWTLSQRIGASHEAQTLAHLGERCGTFPGPPRVQLFEMRHPKNGDAPGCAQRMEMRPKDGDAPETRQGVREATDTE
jgi:hypothetical protein